MLQSESAEEEFTVELAGKSWTLKPQKYHAKSLVALREKYRAIGDKRALDTILGGSGCLTGLLDQ